MDWLKIRFDLRGHGRSGKPKTEEGYSSKKHAEDYAAVANEFKAKNPIVVGWYEYRCSGTGEYTEFAFVKEYGRCHC